MKANTLTIAGAAAGATSIFLSIRKNYVKNPFTAKEMQAWSVLLGLASVGLAGVGLIRKHGNKLHLEL